MPKIDKHLIGKRLDISESYYLTGGGSKIRWSQGKISLISNGANIGKIGSRSACCKSGDAVLIRWDSNKERNEPTSTSPQRIMSTKTKLKKHTIGRFNPNIHVYILDDTITKIH